MAAPQPRSRRFFVVVFFLFFPVPPDCFTVPDLNQFVLPQGAYEAIRNEQDNSR